VTFDGELVWFAREDELVAFDPKREAVVKRHSIPGVAAGTAFDGEHVYQLAGAEILVVEPASGRVVRRFPAPGKGTDSGMAWADGFLWVGQYRDSKINKIDPKTGEIVKTLRSDRFVTGVSCVDGVLWHGVSGDGSPPELRRLASDPAQATAAQYFEQQIRVNICASIDLPLHSADDGANTSCNAVSFALGFDADPALIGEDVPVTPRVCPDLDASCP
jgi:hypothetical protein